MSHFLGIPYLRTSKKYYDYEGAWQTYAYDFNEQPSALHASYLIRQSYYVSSSLPKDTIIIGHSYGGLLTDENRVLLGSPIIKSPITLSYTMYHYHKNLKKDNILKSIGGGGNDVIVKTENMIRNTIETNLFMDRGVDHKALTWCGQVLEAVVDIIKNKEDDVSFTNIGDVEDDDNFSLLKLTEFVFIPLLALTFIPNYSLIPLTIKFIGDDIILRLIVVLGLVNLIMGFRLIGRLIKFRGFRCDGFERGFRGYISGSILIFLCLYIHSGFTRKTDTLISITYLILLSYTILRSVILKPSSMRILRAIILGICSIGNVAYAWSNILCVDCEVVEEVYVRVDLIVCFIILTVIHLSEDVEVKDREWIIIITNFAFIQYYEYGFGWYVHAQFGVIAVIRLMLYYSPTRKSTKIE